jgi:hypothetical protein
MDNKRLERQKILRKENNNAYTKKYEKTHNGFLVRKYRNMLSRVSGVQKKKNHLYSNLEIMSKVDFYEWAKGSKEFFLMFDVYEKSNYDRKLCPTVDRINPELGYIKSNIRWLTHSENSRLTRRNN